MDLSETLGGCRSWMIGLADQMAQERADFSMKTIPISPIAVGFLLFLTGHAQPEPPPQEDHTDGKKHEGQGGWTKADTDGDGVLSWEEFNAIERIGKLPEEKRVGLFKRLDSDDNGSLSGEELERGRARGNRGKPMRRLWELDVDKSGGVSFEEFNTGEMFAKLPAEKQKELFRRLDSDGDGQITSKDQPAPRRAPEAKDIIKRLDKDGDGKLSAEELDKDPFFRWMIDRQIQLELGNVKDDPDTD